MAQGANAFALLPDDNDGDIDDFINKVAAQAKIIEEEETKKQRQQYKAAATNHKVDSQREKRLNLATMRARKPFIPGSLYKSQIVFRQPKAQDQESEDNGAEKEKEQDGFRDDSRIANDYPRDREGNYRSNYRNNNGGYNRYQRYNGGEGDHYRRNNERGDFYEGGEKQGYVGEGGYSRNYTRGCFYQRNNGYQENDNGGDDAEGYIAYRGRRRGGRGRSRWGGFSENYNDSSEHNNNNVVTDDQVQVSDNPERKEVDVATEQPEANGNKNDEDEAAEDSREGEKKKKKKNSKADDSKYNKIPQQEDKNLAANTMTYREYEKKLLEKKKALEELLNAEKPKGSADKDFESMIPIGKNTGEGSKLVVKPKVSGENLKIKEKRIKSMNIDEFLKPPPRRYRGERYGNGRGWGNDRCGFQRDGERNNDGSDNGQELSRQPSGAPAPPSFEDIGQFPSLGQELANSFDLANRKI
ncbi:hypothetical protein JCGZ_14404 [Jatropha curcas]|uniref:Hyaluronan/mRNA-binding protein domain-containing protein n=1 Tax=Jatropha curcas TaxID=180498 RepID=A0A067K0P6_JATCU|nr:RGG repeats nuclear RNA binding protein C [Jatropha curcas]KDP28633.1 hypothetical protein JCGZ_14404 [Jatropha curcas]